MDAALILIRIAELLNRHKLEAVMVGRRAPNRIAFAFRRTPANLTKLTAIGRELRAALWRQIPDGGVFQIRRHDSNAHIDFISAPRFEALREYALLTRAGAYELLAAVDADRRDSPADATPRIARQAWAERKNVRQLPLRERILHWQALPPERRTNFLRSPVGGFGSWL